MSANKIEIEDPPQKKPKKEEKIKKKLPQSFLVGISPYPI